ncbi:dihydrofolate reductase family protein [Kitasatospora sp. NPDC096147]|uniref:dihydrofolate reductase family protein n=1 Tax=Kitasatospora sp. NPDC096147 TaxID=3364093 RepID=UPI00382EF13C
MRKLVYYVGVTIDGYIAGPGGEYDFFPLNDSYSAWMNGHLPETVPTPMRAALGLTETPAARFDTVLMGLGTYRPALDAGLTDPYAHLRTYVVSSTLPADTDPAVTVVKDDPLGLVRQLKRQEGRDIWLCGGGLLAGALLPEIDELVVKSYPVLAGSGIPMVAGGFAPTLFTPTDRKSFDTGTTVTWLSRNTT